MIKVSDDTIKILSKWGKKNNIANSKVMSILRSFFIDGKSEKVTDRLAIGDILEMFMFSDSTFGSSIAMKLYTVHSLIDSVTVYKINTRKKDNGKETYTYKKVNLSVEDIEALYYGMVQQVPEHQQRCAELFEELFIDAETNMANFLSLFYVKIDGEKLNKQIELMRKKGTFTPNMEVLASKCNYWFGIEDDSVSNSYGRTIYDIVNEFGYLPIDVLGEVDVIK